MIESLQYLGFEPRRDYIARDDGAGPYIAQWLSTFPQPTAAELLAAELPAAKLRRIADINAECRARLIARYGDAVEQVTRSIGGYGQAEQEGMRVGIESTIDASNVARNQVLAAADIAAVEAVAVAWPSI